MSQKSARGRATTVRHRGIRRRPSPHRASHPTRHASLPSHHPIRRRNRRRSRGRRSRPGSRSQTRRRDKHRDKADTRKARACRRVCWIALLLVAVRNHALDVGDVVGPLGSGSGIGHVRRACTRTNNEVRPSTDCSTGRRISSGSADRGTSRGAQAVPTTALPTPRCTAACDGDVGPITLSRELGDIARSFGR